MADTAAAASAAGEDAAPPQPKPLAPHGLRELAVPAIVSFLFKKLSDARWAQERLKAERAEGERAVLAAAQSEAEARAEAEAATERREGAGAAENEERGGITRLMEEAQALHREAVVARGVAENLMRLVEEAQHAAVKAEQRAAEATAAALAAAAAASSLRRPLLLHASDACASSSSGGILRSFGIQAIMPPRGPTRVSEIGTNIMNPKKSKKPSGTGSTIDVLKRQQADGLADVESKVLEALLEAELGSEEWMFVSNPILPFSGSGFRKRFGMPAYQWLETLGSVETSFVAVGGAPRVRLRVVGLYSC
jgi:hypothetical protein